jgi:hypothetical protein
MSYENLGASNNIGIESYEDDQNEYYISFSGNGVGDGRPQIIIERDQSD